MRDRRPSPKKIMESDDALMREFPPSSRLNDRASWLIISVNIAVNRWKSGIIATVCPFMAASPQIGIQVIGSRKEVLRQKGFYEAHNLGGVDHDHPMYGRVCIYPGGAIKQTLPRRRTCHWYKYLESLHDSSYTVIEDANSYTARCGVCGAVGNPFPVELGPPFPHKANCSQGNL